MDQNAWLMFFVGIAITSGLIALGLVLFTRLKSGEQGYPFEAAVEAALLPIIFQGICAAYRLNEKSLSELDQFIRGADKKKIADSIYQMLPDKVNDLDLSLVKRIVTKERFAQLVQDVFDRFDRFFIEHQAHFDELFLEWKTTNLPA